MKLLLLIAFVLTVCNLAHSQSENRKIYGIIVDSETKQGIANASVKLNYKGKNLYENYERKADDTGAFKFDLKDGFYSISAWSDLYNAVEIGFPEFGSTKGDIEVDLTLFQTKVEKEENSYGVKQITKYYKDLGIGIDTSNLPFIDFDFNSSYFNSSNKAALKKAAKYLRENPEVRIRIESFAINYKTAKYNDWLNKRRVDRIATWLTAIGGISPNRIEKSYYDKNRTLGYTNRAFINRRCRLSILP